MSRVSIAQTGRKLVIVGDGNCGKTCLLITFSSGIYPTGYPPSIFDTFARKIEVNGTLVDLALWDTAGQEDYDYLRPMSYSNTDVLLICFSVDYPVSLQNVLEKWVPEVERQCPEVPFILVGLKADLRTDRAKIAELKRRNKKFVRLDEGESIAKKIGATMYVECSAMKNEGVKELFEMAASVALSERKKKKSGSKKKCVLM